MREGNKKNSLLTGLLAGFILLMLLAAAVVPVLAVPVGNDDVTFIRVRYDFPNAGESTWYYAVTSGSAPAISHIVFELNLGCLEVLDAGTWVGTDQDTLNPGGGSPVIGTDPTTGITGIKFDEAFEEDETRGYYFTVSGNYAKSNTVVVASKGGAGYDTALIEGPSPTCAPYTPPAAPSLDIEKSTNGEDADMATGPVLVVGDAVNWDYSVTNTGNVTLTNIEVSDDQLGEICVIESLVAGASTTCSASGSAAVGQYANLGTASTTYGTTAVSDSDPSHYLGVNPAVDIEKYTNGEDADDAPGPEIAIGGAVSWTYVVTNTGDVGLTNVVVGDDQLGAVCNVASLDAGMSTTCEMSGTATAGQYENLGTVTADYGTRQVTDQDYSHYFGFDPTPDMPALDLEKSTNGQDADEPSGPEIFVGDPVEWTYTVHNTGNVTLNNIVVTDDKLGAVCTIATLAPDGVASCSMMGTAAAGQYANVGSAATQYNGVNVSDSDPSHYFGANPALDIEKYTNGVDADTPTGPQILVGDPVVWTYVVTNTGNFTLPFVIVGDDLLGIICTTGELAPGQTLTCSATGTAVEGQYTNLGKASSRYPDQSGVRVDDQDRSHYLGVKPFVPKPSLDFEKHTNGADSDEAPGLSIPVGSPVLWEYIVTNTGNVELTDIHVGDNILGTVCVIPSLSPGDTHVCTMSGFAAEGQYMNIGKAVTWWGGGPKTGGIKVGDVDRSHYTGVK